MEDESRNKRLGPMAWTGIIALCAILAVSLIYAVTAWEDLGAVSMSAAGWLFLILGVVITLGVGGGLMWLVFYSARHHYDR